MKKSTIAEYRKVIALQIVKKLAPYGTITKKHSKKETLLSGIPKENMKLANEIFADFERNGLIAKHPTKHGITYEITKRGKEEFKAVLDEYIRKKKEEFGLKRID